MKIIASHILRMWSNLLRWVFNFRSTSLTLYKKKSRYTPWWRLGERRYSFYSFKTSALDGGEWSASRPGRALPPGKRPPVPIVQEAGWAPEPVWTQRPEEKSFAPCRGSNLYRPVVQPVARHYTAWATRLCLTLYSLVVITSPIYLNSL
jgi:hypothetical protein